jgi:hypothetical protein
MASSCRKSDCAGAHGEGGTRQDPDHIVVHSHARRTSSKYTRECRHCFRTVPLQTLSKTIVGPDRMWGVCLSCAGKHPEACRALMLLPPRGAYESGRAARDAYAAVVAKFARPAIARLPARVMFDVLKSAHRNAAQLRVFA